MIYKGWDFEELLPVLLPYMDGKVDGIAAAEINLALYQNAYHNLGHLGQADQVPIIAETKAFLKAYVNDKLSRSLVKYCKLAIEETDNEEFLLFMDCCICSLWS